MLKFLYPSNVTLDIVQSLNDQHSSHGIHFEIVKLNLATFCATGREVSSQLTRRPVLYVVQDVIPVL